MMVVGTPVRGKNPEIVEMALAPVYSWLMALQSTTIIPIIVSILSLLVSLLSYRHTRRARRQMRQLETASRKSQVLTLLQRAWLTHLETQALYSILLGQIARFPSLAPKERQRMYNLAADREDEQKVTRQLELIRKAVESYARPHDEIFFEEQIPMANELLALAESLLRAAQMKANALRQDIETYERLLA